MAKPKRKKYPRDYWFTVVGQMCLPWPSLREAKSCVERTMLRDKWAFGLIIKPGTGQTWQAALFTFDLKKDIHEVRWKKGVTSASRYRRPPPEKRPRDY